MPKVSIIIPVYNVANYLVRCLDSVCKQTLQELEIICINDCSTDNSLEILEQYAKQDSRIKIINLSQNQGSSAARNAGINVAIGEFMGFVDADDYIDIDYYEKLYTNCKNHNADISKALIFRDSIKLKKHEEEYNKNINKDKYFYHMDFTTAIYKSTIIKQNAIQFPLGIHNNEDIIFLTKAVYFSNKVVAIFDTFYFYTMRQGSASRQIPTTTTICNIIHANNLIIDFISQVKVSKDYYDFIFKECLARIFYFSLHAEEISEQVAEKTIQTIEKYKYHESIHNQNTLTTKQSPVATFRKMCYEFVSLNTQTITPQFIIYKLHRLIHLPSVCFLFLNEFPANAKGKLFQKIKQFEHKNFNILLIGHQFNAEPFLKLNPLTSSQIKIRRKQCLELGTKLFNKATNLAELMQYFSKERVEVLTLAGLLHYITPDILHYYEKNSYIKGIYMSVLAQVPCVMLSSKSHQESLKGRTEKLRSMEEYLSTQTQVIFEDNFSID